MKFIRIKTFGDEYILPLSSMTSLCYQKTSEICHICIANMCFRIDMPFLYYHDFLNFIRNESVFFILQCEDKT